MRRSTYLVAGVAALSALVSACSMRQTAAARTADDTAQAEEDIEGPAYTVEKSAAAPAGFSGDIELRRYTPTIVAQTAVQAPHSSLASNRGFRPLAEFIFGKNRPNAKIAMTAPVTTMASGGDTIAMTAPVTTIGNDGERDADNSARNAYIVQFTMPAEYTMATLPQPIDPAVEIVQMPARNVIAVRFIGYRTDDRVTLAQDAIAAFMRDNGLTPTGPFAVAGYDGPSVDRSRQRWEVHRPVAQTD